MKKWLTITMALFLVLSLGACAQNAGVETAEEPQAASEPATAEAAAPEAAAEPEAAAQKGFVIGFSNYNNEISWRTQMEREFTYQAEQLKAQGVISEFYVYEANGDQAKQISDINDLITMGVDAIVLPAITTDGLNDVLQVAMDEGIIVVNFDNNCSLDVSCKLTVSDYNHGWVSGQWLGDQLIANGTEEGNIIILRGAVGTSTDANRYQGGFDGIMDKCPNVKVIAEEACNWDYASAKTAVETLLATYPQIDGLISQGGAMTQAAIDAFNEAGRPLCPMTGEAGNGFLNAWIENSDKGFESMAFNNPAFSSRIALDCAIKLLQGGTIDDCAALITSGYGVTPAVDGTTLNLAFASVTLEEAKTLYDSKLNDDFWPGTYLPHEELEKIFPVA